MAYCPRRPGGGFDADFSGEEIVQQALAAKVLNTAKGWRGGGFLHAATQYLKDDAFRSSKPKILIWEVPERFLGMELGEEKTWLQAVGLRQ